MRILKPEQLTELHTSSTDKLQIYNGCDIYVTLAAFRELEKEMNEDQRLTYQRTINVLGTSLLMNSRGILVDDVERKRLVDEKQKDIERVRSILNKISLKLTGVATNANSPKQVLELFDHLGFEQIKIFDRNKKKFVRSSNGEALTKLADKGKAEQFIVNLITKIKEDTKLIGTILEPFENNINKSMFNPLGTETGRWAVKSGTGGLNVQTATNRIRKIFIPRPTFTFAYPDLEQAESRSVGLICRQQLGKDKYFEDCCQLDIHSAVCRSMWGKDLTKEQLKAPNYYRHFSMRDIAKRLGHGTNYGGTAFQLAKTFDHDPKMVEQFQQEYFRTYPEIREWHYFVARELQTKAQLTTPLRRIRYFLGFVTDKQLLKSAIAYAPQSLVADILNEGLINLMEIDDIHLLAQVHDAVLIEVPDTKLEEKLPLIKSALEIDVDGMVIPTEMVTGKRWDFK